MHLHALIALATLLPVAGAEGFDLRAGGMTLGFTQGVAGFQWDDDAGVGTRYWVNLSKEAPVALLTTVCVTNDAGTFYYCERHPLSP